MKLLLDTHIWIWSHLEPRHLTPRVARVLQATGTELWLSPFSVWEFLLLAERGRLELRGDPHAWVDAALRRVPMHEAALTSTIAARSRLIDVPTQDPADRFLAATAAVLELTLVTSDARLLKGRGYRTMANRIG